MPRKSSHREYIRRLVDDEAEGLASPSDIEDIFASTGKLHPHRRRRDRLGTRPPGTHSAPSTTGTCGHHAQAYTYASHQNDFGSPESANIANVISPRVLNLRSDIELSSGVSVELHVTLVPNACNR